MLETLFGLATTALVALFSAWAGVWFSLKRYRHEKWWEKKADAYEKLIDALHTAKIFNDKHLAALKRIKGMEDEEETKLFEIAIKSQNEILRAIDVGSFLFSDLTIERLKRYQNELGAISTSATWQELIEHDQNITKPCLDDLIVLAKSDLKIH